MNGTILHFVFTPSGAGCLLQALRKAGRDDQVIASFENFSFGPIDPSDSSSRAKWIESELGEGDWNRPPASSERLWDEARFPDNRKVVWLTRRSAMEYAGFLEWLWHAGEAPCEVVDLTDVEVSSPSDPTRPPDLAITLGMLHPDTIRFNKLWDLAEPLQMTTRDHYLNLWRQLRIENAPLRVIGGGTLVSAPISFFDRLLMSYVTDNWQKVARVVAYAMVSDMDDSIIQTGDMVLAARINALVGSGRLEIRGRSAFEITKSEIRLPRTNLSD